MGSTIYTDIDLTLPSSGVYAKTSNYLINATFPELQVNVSNTAQSDLTGGTFELVMEYRTATTDPFQSQPVATVPDKAYSYLAHYPLKSGPSSLTSGSSADLVFDLTAAPLSVKSTDVEIFVTYKKNNQAVAFGLKDISEPTPVDIFNNTDYTCINSQWYPSGSPELFLLKYNADVFLYGLRDMYPHDLANISFWAQSPDKTILTSAAALAPNSARRLGYILTDFTFTYGFSKNWLHTDPYDTWANLIDPATTYPGTAVKNTAASYPGMYNMRGKPIWWGAGGIFNNTGYREGWSSVIDNSCSWDALP